MATEDHDFEEINHINLFGSKIDWQHQDIENSVVGRISTEVTTDFVNNVLDKFNDAELRAKVQIFLSVYQKDNALSSANRKLINNLFGEYGLVILDGDDFELKKYFGPIAKTEIEKGITFESVSETNRILDSHGFHQQVLCSRE